MELLFAFTRSLAALTPSSGIFPSLVMIIHYELARGLSEPAQVQMSCHLALS
jgi:hypothetical protein